VQTSGGKPTAKHVEAAVDKIQAGEEEPEETQAAKPEHFTYRPSNGLQYASMAIISMEKIHRNDTERQAAFAKLQKWINDNQ
jgi:hypothetical protein